MADRKPLVIDLDEIDAAAGKHWLHPSRHDTAPATPTPPDEAPPTTEPPNNPKK